MDDPYAVGRRLFLKTGATAVAATASACGGATSRFRVLGEDEALTLFAACNQIVPPDAYPGAGDAGAVRFLDRQLATRWKKELPLWRAGIRGLDATARRRHGKRFADLAFDVQTALLRQVEEGAVDAADWGVVPPRTFFERLRVAALMSFYGDPRHGGNRERASWKMLGLPDPPVRGRLRETTPTRKG
jgi:gluconate 2-dehydrogenase gamma chain